ncbi:hypothetical protein TrCOL_g4367 [Triparma columacea]|uniref:MYND-type domain-containing protein n=1 Tax=Triparma columacea TaxID=722753 RepID=A0A9W7LC76_9STRA|nr:hypothetical protein TrCOL_g4367 [Triparma columacea]
MSTLTLHHPFVISENPERGRFAKSPCSLSIGSIVSSTSAFCSQVSSHLLSKYCSYCFVSFADSSLTPKKCTGGCTSTYYCSRDCQKLDFATHKHECKQKGVKALSDALSLLRTSDPSQFPIDDFLLLRKTYFKLCKESGTKPPSAPPLGVLDKLCVGATNEDEILIALCTTTSILGLSVASSSDLSTHPLTSFFTSLLAKFRCNNFGITNSLQSVVGAGVFEHGAILNHSCAPNCVLHYERSPTSCQVQQTIVVIREVEEGEELCHSYCELAQPTAERRDHLQHTYGFMCRCPRCLDVDLDASLSEIQPDQPLELKEELTTTMALYDEATMRVSDDPDEEHRLGSKCCLLMREVYGKLNLTLYKMESECLATSLMSGDLDSAIDHCTASCTFLASVMPKYHPLTILQFVTLAELSVEGEMWEEAKMAYEIVKSNGSNDKT